MPNPYPVEIKKGDNIAVEGELDFTDPNNRPDALTWRGTWDALTTYDPGDLVEDGGSVYIAIATSLNSEPPSADWDAVVVAGDTGLPVTWTDDGHGSVTVATDNASAPIVLDGPLNANGNNIAGVSKLTTQAANAGSDTLLARYSDGGAAITAGDDTGGVKLHARLNERIALTCTSGDAVVVHDDAGTTTVGFFGPTAVVQQLLDPGSATPEQIATALIASTLMDTAP